MKARVKQFIDNKANELAYTGNIAGKIEKPIKSDQSL